MKLLPGFEVKDVLMVVLLVGGLAGAVWLWKHYKGNKEEHAEVAKPEAKAAPAAEAKPAEAPKA